MTMDLYCVNSQAQVTGEHEVHKASCAYAPDAANRVQLGYHANCRQAVEKARAFYGNVDGCYHCCRECHTK